MARFDSNNKKSEKRGCTFGALQSEVSKRECVDAQKKPSQEDYMRWNKKKEKDDSREKQQEEAKREKKKKRVE